MANRNYEVIAIDEVVERLRMFFGIAGSSISDVIRQFEIERKDWIGLEDWEAFNDIELYKILENVKKPVGRLYLVCETSYRTGQGAFRIDSAHIDRFVSEHHSTFGECMFNGDVLFFCLELESVWIFHHEGVFLVLEAARKIDGQV